MKTFEIGQILHLHLATVQFAISDFGFEMQDLSNFKIFLTVTPRRDILYPLERKRG